jgi:Right handed beta helix region
MITSKIVRFLSAAALVVGFSTMAHAQATRTWVSGVGDDANPCSRTAPCKTFAGAISKTATCGEISVLDPGGFGAVTITKAITINGTGTLAGILASLVNGVIVNPPAGDTVILRDISINGACNGLNGIRFIGGKTLMVDHCWIYGFAQNGIDVVKGTDASLKIIDSVIENCTLDGVVISTTAGQVRSTIDRTRIMNCANGIHAKNNSRVIARNSVFSSNTTNGVFSDATAGFATIRVWESQISLNGGNGVRAGNAGGGASGVEISLNQINHNTSNGVLVGTGGVVETFVNNSIRGNGTDLCPGCSPVNPGN